MRADKWRGICGRGVRDLLRLEAKFFSLFFFSFFSFFLFFFFLFCVPPSLPLQALMGTYSQQSGNFTGELCFRGPWPSTSRAPVRPFDSAGLERERQGETRGPPTMLRQCNGRARPSRQVNTSEGKVRRQTSMPFQRSGGSSPSSWCWR